MVLRRAYCVLRQSGGTARLNLEIAVLNLEIAPSVCCDRAVAPRDPSRDQGVRGRRITPVEDGGGVSSFLGGGNYKGAGSSQAASSAHSPPPPQTAPVVCNLVCRGLPLCDNLQALVWEWCGNLAEARSMPP